MDFGRFFFNIGYGHQALLLNSNFGPQIGRTARPFGRKSMGFWVREIGGKTNDKELKRNVAWELLVQIFFFSYEQI